VGRRGTWPLCVGGALAALILGVAGAGAAGSSGGRKPVHAEAPALAERVVADGSQLLLIKRPFNHEGRLTRVDLDGRVDRSFGDGGMVAIGAQDAVVLPDGKILVAGSAESGGGSVARVTRLLPDGSVDGSFGVGGSADVGLGGVAGIGETVAVASDGDVILGAARVDSVAETDEFDESIVAARFTPEGAPDPSFGDGGVKNLGDYGEAEAMAIAATPSGGLALQIGNSSEMSLLELEPDGALDRGFGRHGYFFLGHRRTPSGSESLSFAPGLVALPSGKLVLAATGFGGHGVAGGVFRALAIRLTAAGRLDRSYGDVGFATVGKGAEWTLAEGIAPLPGGAVALATSFESARHRKDQQRKFGAAVLGPNGRPERSFGAQGRCLAALGGDHEAAGAAVVGSKLTVLGTGVGSPWLLTCPLRRPR
jgi:uncharacterized delta-60 repeat protein